MSRVKWLLIAGCASTLALCSPVLAVEVAGLSINGYGSFEYERMLNSDGEGDPNGSFDADSIDVVLNFRPADRFRFAMDLSWEHGTATEDDIGNATYEYGFAEYLFHDALKVRAGKMFTPFGYFNEIHTAKPLFLSVKEAFSFNKPDKILEEAFRMFPRWGAGVAAQGNWELAGKSADYDLFVMNGDSEEVNPYEEDENINKAVAGRVRLDLTPNLQIGNSFYYDGEITLHETVVDANGDAVLDDDGEELTDATSNSMFSDGLTILFTRGRFTLLAEAAISQFEMEGDNDLTQRSWYVQPSFRFNNSLTPYARYEWLDPDADTSNDVGNEIIGGLNYTLARGLVLKIEDGYFFGDNGSSLGELPGNGYHEIKAAIGAMF